MLKLKNICSKNIFYLTIVLCSVLIFSAFPAGAKTGETKQKADDESQAHQSSTDKEKKEKKYIYDPNGKTDPFKSFIVGFEEKEKKKNEKPKTYLETCELSQLTLSVIIIGEKDKWAMVKDSKGDAYVIKEGTPIGTNDGVVYKIKPGEVIIREKYTNPFKGEKEFRDMIKRTPSD